MRIKSQKNDFRTISNEEMAFKMVKIAKYGHFGYVVEYPIWVSIKRSLAGKLALACQNWVYCIRLKENVQKRPKIFGHFDHFKGHFLITSGPKIIFLRLNPHYQY